MKITIFAKKNKPHIKAVINVLKQRGDNVTAFLGERGDLFPEEAKNIESDLVLSYLSPWIVPKHILEKTTKWNINFHPGPPEYPGIGCFNFALYDEANEYGVTAHIMEEKVDSGHIVGIRRFPIKQSDSVYSLSITSYDEMYALFCDIMQYVRINSVLPECTEQWIKKPYTRNQLNDLCKIDVSMLKNEIARRIRATTYPDMPGAYISCEGYRFEYKHKELRDV